MSIISFALILLVIYSRYSSTVLAAIVLTNIPLGLIGSVAALWIAGLAFSVASLIGFITLAGISAHNGILTVSHYINLALNEGEQFGRDLVVRANLERLTPVPMTAISAGLALVPLIIAANEPGPGNSASIRRNHIRRADLRLSSLSKRCEDCTNGQRRPRTRQSGQFCD